MKNFFKGKIVTAFVVVATVILAGVAVFTALRLYQLRQESVAPTAPESKPGAATNKIACELLSFTITQNSPTPTPTSSVTSTPTPTLPPDVTATPTSAPTLTPTQPPGATSTPNPTATPTQGAGPTNTPTPTGTFIAAASPTPSGSALPDAGISFPTIAGFAIGILIIVIALTLAL